jgi:hypothetical protein
MDRHGPVQPLNICQLLDPPHFSLVTTFKGRPEDAKWNVLNHTSFRNYAPFSLQVPSILSILLVRIPIHLSCQIPDQLHYNFEK